MAQKRDARTLVGIRIGQPAARERPIASPACRPALLQRQCPVRRSSAAHGRSPRSCISFCALQVVAQHDPRIDRVRVVEDPLRFVEQADRSVAIVQAHVDAGEHAQHPHALARLVAQLPGQALAGVVEHGADRLVARQGLGRIGRLEHVGQELRHVLGVVAFLAGEIAFVRDPLRLHPQCRHERGDECERRHGKSDRQRMPSQEFACAIQALAAHGDHRFSVEVTAQVVRELLDRAVAFARRLAQRVGDDRVEIAAQFACQRDRRRMAPCACATSLPARIARALGASGAISRIFCSSWPAVSPLASNTVAPHNSSCSRVPSW